MAKKVIYIGSMVKTGVFEILRSDKYIYYSNPEHSVVLLKGNCIEILDSAEEGTADMIFADPPYLLSNGGIICHAGRMVSVNRSLPDWQSQK